MGVDTQELRRQAVLNILREGEPQTIEEIATRMNGNYYTIRKSIQELEELGLCHRTGMVRNRKELWAAGVSTGIPELYDPGGNRKIPVDEVAMATESGTPASVKAASAFFESLQQLIGIAVGLNDGSASVNIADLQKLRNQMIVHKSYLKNLVGYYEQVLQNPQFWNIDDLGAIGLQVQSKRSS